VRTHLVQRKQLHQLADKERVVSKVRGNVVLQLEQVVRSRPAANIVSTRRPDLDPAPEAESQSYSYHSLPGYTL
jgi:hypothetical protein